MATGTFAHMIFKLLLILLTYSIGLPFCYIFNCIYFQNCIIVISCLMRYPFSLGFIAMSLRYNWLFLPKLKKEKIDTSLQDSYRGVVKRG